MDIIIDVKGLDFNATYGLIILRDKHCQFTGCQEVKHLRVHHIIPSSKGGSDAPDNLIVYCEKHHVQMHHQINDNGKAQILKLREIMMEYDISLSTLAMMLGKTQPTLSNTLKNVPPGVKQALAIIKIINKLTKKSYTVEDLYKML